MKQNNIDISKIVVIYYGIKNKKDEPTITVCTIYNPKKLTTARGVSIRSYKDKVNIEEGKKNALNYAKRALMGRMDKPIECPEAIKQVVRCGCSFTYHSQKDPELTFFERRELFGDYKRKFERRELFGDYKRKIEVMNKLTKQYEYWFTFYRKYKTLLSKQQY